MKKKEDEISWNAVVMTLAVLALFILGIMMVGVIEKRVALIAKAYENDEVRLYCTAEYKSCSCSTSANRTDLCRQNTVDAMKELNWT
jgi:hypothetical protein